MAKNIAIGIQDFGDLIRQNCFYIVKTDFLEKYEITSNRESGFGRYDVLLVPKMISADDAVILEFKVFNPAKENSLEDTAKSALHQIEEKNYSASLIQKGIPKNHIHKYGFAFQGKQVLIL